jgi:hypothetical protein
MGNGEVKSNVKEEEDNTKFGKQMHGAARREHFGPNGRDPRAKDEIADDWADTRQPRKDCGDDSCCEQDQDWNNRICDFHEIPGLERSR